ncbi:MAG: molybdopterin-binding protein [Clostridia bacterium]
MKCIDTRNAVGHVLCHDLTRIVPGEWKGAQFRKGHVVTSEDIPMLLSMGKEQLYVWEMNEQKLHENDAADRLAKLCENAHMRRGELSEGKIELFAECDGLFQVDTERLLDMNMLDEMMIATRHSDVAVHAGDKLCGMRVIPLVIDLRRIEEAERLMGKVPLLTLTPFRPMKAGIVTTGSEVFHHRIEDRFTPVVVKKLAEYGIETVRQTVVDDATEHIVAAIAQLRKQGVDLVVCTGGMSVDPDDRTPAAIRQSGASIVSYGAPVLPGAMLMLGYYSDAVPVLGLPGCVMYAQTTVFDLILPHIAAGVCVSRVDLAKLGCGGLCLGCKPCHYPDCEFGKRSY